MNRNKNILLLVCLLIFMVYGCANNGHINDKKTDYQWLIEPGIYDDIKFLDEKLFAVKDSSGKYGLINDKTKPIVECQYFNILDAQEQIVRAVDLDHRLLFVDYEGNSICKETFQDAYGFSEGLAAVKKDDKWGFINRGGTLVINYQYDNVNKGFKEGVALVEKEGVWHFIDQNGEVVFDDMFEAASVFSEGLAAVKLNDKWGFIDHSGDLVIDCQYDGVGNFSEGKASVMKVINGVKKWAYINKDNAIVLDYKLYSSSEGRMETVGEFHNGYALVTDELYCLINEQGEVVLGSDSCFLTAGGIYDLETGYLAAYNYIDDAMMEKKYGVININGEIIVPYVFENITEIKGELAVVKCRYENALKTGVIRINNTGTF